MSVSDFGLPITCLRQVKPVKLTRTLSDDDIAISAFVEHLKKQGHTCVGIDKIQQNKVNWCLKTHCIESSK